jgi:hypothetical protein
MSGVLETLGAGLGLAGLAAFTGAAGRAAAILINRDPDRAARLETGFLRWARIAFLALGAAVAASLGAGAAAGAGWPLFAWALCFTVLHCHRVKAYKGRRTAAAGILGWALAALAWLATR